MVFISLHFMFRFGLYGRPVFKCTFINNTNVRIFLPENNIEKIKRLLLSVNFRVVQFGLNQMLDIVTVVTRLLIVVTTGTTTEKLFISVCKL